MSDVRPADAPLSSESARRRFVVLSASRWTSVGFLIPVFFLFALRRDVTLAELGVLTALHGLTVGALELPTGGLADALGRRRVLLGASLLNVVSLVVALVAYGFWMWALSYVLQATYRALQSGPLDAWYVDAAQAADPAADIERGLSGAGVATGIAMATASGVAGVALALGAPLEVPIVLATFAAIVDIALLALLMTEVRRPRGWSAFSQAARGVPNVIRTGLRLAGRVPQIRVLVAIEFLWAVTIVAFEVYWQPRLAGVAGTDEHPVFAIAAVVMWAANAAGAAMVPTLTGWLGDAARVGVLLKVLQGAAIASVALGLGLPPLVALIGLAYVAHGAANPVHVGLLHRNGEAATRATLVSINSLGGQVGLLTAIPVGLAVAAFGIPPVWIGAGALMVLSAPLYLFARPTPLPAGAQGT